MVYFDWDDADDLRGNVAHLAANDVEPAEFEEVLGPDPIPREFSRASGRPLKRGRTATGRDLVIIYEIQCDDPWIVRPVTAFEPDSIEDD